MENAQTAADAGGPGVLTQTMKPGRRPTAQGDFAGIGRPALFERLSGAGERGVMLVCAPAGSGKTVLLRSWAQAEGLADQVAWVSVERGERDGQRFWLSLIDALAGVVGAVEHVAPAPGFRSQLLADRLLSELSSLEERLVMVVDDLHELRSADALAWLELFLARLPSWVLGVLVTREDPRLGLHRLRLAGELTELRGPDLRFSLDETRALLAGTGIALSEAGVALLHERTEGWGGMGGRPAAGRDLALAASGSGAVRAGVLRQ
jgi:LuxR family transcriptional regulator, maltose regulon positive regulatory protein